MKRIALSFLKSEDAQSMVEYSLLLAFMTLASTALFLDTSNSIYGIWLTTNTRLSAACSVAS